MLFKRINEYITLRLENNETIIYVLNEPFRQCKALFLNIFSENVSDFETIKSVDEIDEFYERSNENKGAITPEEEFWGHCSNIEAWVNHDYDTNVLHSNLSFWLLKELARVGDEKAKAVFKDEIASKLSSNYFPTILFLISENFLDFLDEGHVKSIIFDLERKGENNSLSPSLILYFSVKYSFFTHFYKYLDKMKSLDSEIKYQAIKQLCLMFKDSNDSKNSLFWYKKLIKIKRDEEDFHHLGQVYHDLEKYNKAIECYEKAIELTPNDDWHFHDLGHVYHDVGNFNRAIECFEKALEIEHENDVHYHCLGRVYYDLGDFRKAIECFERAIEINPHDDEAQFILNLVFIFFLKEVI